MTNYAQRQPEPFECGTCALPACLIPYCLQQRAFSGTALGERCAYLSQVPVCHGHPDRCAACGKELHGVVLSVGVKTYCMPCGRGLLDPAAVKPSSPMQTDECHDHDLALDGPQYDIRDALPPAVCSHCGKEVCDAAACMCISDCCRCPVRGTGLQGWEKDFWAKFNIAYVRPRGFAELGAEICDFIRSVESRALSAARDRADKAASEELDRHANMDGCDAECPGDHVAAAARNAI